MVRASCFEVLSASVESRKLFLDGSLCLARRWPWSACLGSSSWRQRSALAATFRRMWGGAIPASAYEHCIGVAFKQPVIILHVSFSGGETTWTNTGVTQYGRGQHKTGSFGDDMLRPSPNHGTQRLPNDDDDDDHSERCQHAQYVWNGPTKNRHIQLSKNKAPMRLFVR